MAITTEKAIDLRFEVIQMTEEALQDHDLFLVDVIVRGRQGSRVIEVFVDGEKGVGVDSLAAVSRQIAFLLETEDLIRGKYHLNVSSPGEEKALVLPKQYSQHAGRKLKVKTRLLTSDGDNVVETGILESSSEQAIVVLLDSGEKKEISFDEIEEARIVMPW